MKKNKANEFYWDIESNYPDKLRKDTERELQLLKKSVFAVEWKELLRRI